jgi:predicted amidophosphoribosyltransferase
MPICVCEYCGKPFNNVGVKLCPACSKLIDEAYVKVRRYIWQNPKTSDFGSIVEATDVPEKALNYLINKGRIEIASKSGVGHRCRACGKETSGGALCDQCAAKILAENLTAKAEEAKRKLAEDAKKKILPTSFGDD